MDQHILPNLAVSDTIPVEDIIQVSLRLTDLMAEETEHFRSMNIAAVTALQEEKNQLLIWLEAQQKMLAVHPEPAALIDDEDRDALEATIAEFTAVAKENFHQASIARDVNKRVVEAVTKAIQEQEVVSTYTPNGSNRNHHHVPISYKLNQNA
jgi:flagellar biosynthesis/type III secretory pathway chaperone